MIALYCSENDNAGENIKLYERVWMDVVMQQVESISISLDYIDLLDVINLFAPLI